jgi:UDP:flavonoid glycosyltransferase YjiC (YdhE family)
MSHYLLATWSGGGNVPPVLAIATELVRRGDTVRVIGHDDQRATVEAAGFSFEPYPTGLQWEGSTGSNPVAMFRIFHDTGLGTDVLASIAREPVDAVIVDCMLLGVLKAVQQTSTPTIVIAHSFMSFWHRWRRNPLTAFFSMRLGARADRLWNAASATIVTALPELDEAATTDDAHTTWVGPVVPAESTPSNGDAVLVSLSSVNLPGQRAVLQRAIDAIASLDLPLIVTTGPAIDAAGLRLPAGAEVHRYLPHPEAMRRARLVIGHGGHGTTMTALAHDLPLVMIPLHPMIDQPMVAAAVERAGAGLALKKSASSATIAAAVQRLLDEPEHRAAAARLGADIRESHAAAHAADRIAQALTGRVSATRE